MLWLQVFVNHLATGSQICCQLLFYSHSPLYYHILTNFERCNFCGFHGQLAICILKISLAKIWLVVVGEQDTSEWPHLTLASDESN